MNSMSDPTTIKFSIAREFIADAVTAIKSTDTNDKIYSGE